MIPISGDLSTLGHGPTSVDMVEAHLIGFVSKYVIYI